MGFPVKSEWHNWQYTSAAGYEGQGTHLLSLPPPPRPNLITLPFLVAGYAVEYDVSNTKSSLKSSNGNSFTFATIRGGRHEVPESAPAQGFEMLKRLFDKTPF